VYPNIGCLPGEYDHISDTNIVSPSRVKKGAEILLRKNKEKDPK
jgi:hypothetical protein